MTGGATGGETGELDGLATLDHETARGGDVVDDLATGTTLGRYQVMGRIGSGAMGVVLAAYDPHLDRRVALKVLHGGDAFTSSSSTATPERLMREAQALAKLAHPNVVTVHDVGIVDGRVFLAMELVAGVTLREWCKHAERSSSEILGKLMVAARGLAAAHAVGLVHRDFKPDNVMVGDDGRVRVLDFGLARTAERQAPVSLDEPEDFDEQLTQAGALLGTPAYMAPEQFVGGSVDARTDQFALCVTTWELVYGERPFRAPTPAMLGYEILRSDPKPPPDDRGVPAWLHPILLRGLAKAPDDRHPSLDALIEAVEAHLRPAPSRPRRFAAGVVLATVGALGVGIWLARDGDQPRCDLAEARIAEVWNAERRVATAEAFGATGRSYAADTAERVSQAIDDWTKRWAERHTEACEATHVRHEQSLASMELRMRCLEQQRKQLDAHVTLLMDADVDLVGRASAATAELARPETCDDVDRLSRAMPLPADPALAQRIREIEDESQRWRAMLAAGRLSALRAELEPVVDEVVALGHAPLSANVLSLLSRTFAKLSERGAAHEAAHRAAVAALASGDAKVIAETMVLRCRTLAYAGHYDEASTCLDLADGAAKRDGSSSTLEAALVTARGHVAVEQGRHDEAVAATGRALEIVEASTGQSHDLVMALFTHGEVCRVSRRFDEATSALTRAVELGERLLGSRHPDLAGSLNSLAVVHIEEGRTEDALRELERVLEIRKEVFGESHDYVAGTYNNMGYANMHGERYAEALELFERAVAMRESAGGEGALKVPGMQRSIAECLLALDRLPDALAMAQRSVDGHGENVREADRCESLETLAKVHDRLGDPRAASRARAQCHAPAP